MHGNKPKRRGASGKHSVTSSRGKHIPPHRTWTGVSRELDLNRTAVTTPSGGHSSNEETSGLQRAHRPELTTTAHRTRASGVWEEQEEQRQEEVDPICLYDPLSREVFDDREQTCPNYDPVGGGQRGPMEEDRIPSLRLELQLLSSSSSSVVKLKPISTMCTPIRPLTRAASWKIGPQPPDNS